MDNTVSLLEYIFIKHRHHSSQGINVTQAMQPEIGNLLRHVRGNVRDVQIM